MKKFLKIGLLLGVIAAIGVYVFVFYLPTKSWYNDIKKEKGGSFTAIQIVNDFKANEDSATKKYPSDKAIAVEGVIKNLSYESGKSSIWLASEDSTINVNFIMRDSLTNLKIGEKVTLSGACTGKLDDVLFNDGVMVK